MAVPKAPRRRIVEFPRRRRRRAEKMNPHGAEGAAPKKSTLAAPKAPRRKNRENGTISFTFAADPIIELKKIINFFHLLGSFTFQILAIIIELKKSYESYCTGDVITAGYGDAPATAGD